MKAWEKWKQRARNLKVEAYTIYLVYRHPRTPWYAKLLALGVVAYAFSPIDLIPDFIPIFGYLDDLVIVPLGVALVLKLTPQPVLVECREKARAELGKNKPAFRAAVVVILGLWLLLAVLAAILVVRALSG